MEPRRYMLSTLPNYIQWYNALELQKRQNILQLRLRRAADGALDQAVGVGLGCEHLGVLAGVLEALVPAEVWGS
jgi:hypothetical protein